MADRSVINTVENLCIAYFSLDAAPDGILVLFFRLSFLHLLDHAGAEVECYSERG
jgi:hypothetical protein